MRSSGGDVTAQAKALFAERRYHEAVRACRRVLLRDPGALDVRLLLGMALLGLGRHEDVRSEMISTLRTAPREPVAYRLLGEAHLRLGDFPNAGDSLNRALSLDPGDEHARELLEEVRLGGGLNSGTVDRWLSSIPPPAAPDPSDLADDADEPATTLIPVLEDSLVEPEAPEPNGKQVETGSSVVTPSGAWEEILDVEAVTEDSGELAATRLAPSQARLLTEPEELPTRAQIPALRESAPPPAPAPVTAPPSSVEATAAARPVRASSYPPAATHRAAPPGSTRAARVARPKKRLPLRLLMTLLLAPLVVVLLSLAAYSAYSRFRIRQQVDHAVQQASDDGLEKSLQRAIDLVERHYGDGGEVPLRVRLHAIAAFEHGYPVSSDIQKQTERLRATDPSSTDGRIAAAYLALAAGNLEDARGAQAGDESGEPELDRARALTALAAGKPDGALAAARSASRTRPHSPRHLSLYALATALSGNVGQARVLLDGFSDEPEPSWIRVVRARILLESGGDPATAATEAAAVTGELRDQATPWQLSWAHYVRATVALAEGKTHLALEHARQAAKSRPRAEEELAFRIVEALVGAGAYREAGEVLEDLPTSSTRPARRRALKAEVALEQGDLELADRSLAQAGNAPHVVYLKGRLAELQGRLDEARTLYERAARDRNELVRASARLGGLELDAGNVERAITLLSEVVGRRPAHLDVVPLFVKALLAAGQQDRARRVVRSALSHRPDAPELKGALAQVTLSQGDVTGALRSLRVAAKQRPENPDLQVTLAMAALRAGKLVEARSAYRRAIASRGGHLAAHVGLVGVELASDDASAAAAAIDHAEKVGAPKSFVARTRARLRVARGEGEPAIRELRRLVEESPNDPGLWVALGRAQLQAERDRAAETTFQRALALDAKNADAHLYLAYLEVRAGRLSRATTLLEQASSFGRRRSWSSAQRARVKAGHGWVAFELGETSKAERRAREALAIDDRCSEAHLLRALLAGERNQDPLPALRAAIRGRAPAAEAISRAVALVKAPERCTLAQRYLTLAPAGFDAADVRKAARDCPAD